jgi:outer membrane protein assembly complex protein YaeT
LTVLWLGTLLGLAMGDATAAGLEEVRATRDLSPRVRWRVAAVHLEGAHDIPERVLWPLLTTRPRPLLTPWKRRPRFERDGLDDDVARLSAYYRGRGYYRARIDYTLETDPKAKTVTVTIRIDEGPPVRVRNVRLDVVDPAGSMPPLDPSGLVPLTAGAVFDEAKYDEGRARLLAWARGAHFARASVTKRAAVDVAAGTADVTYTITPGIPSRFGPITVDGLQRVTPNVVLREVAFTEGGPFDPTLLERTRRNLIRLRLFRSVTLREDDAADAVVPITIRVVEGPHREVRAGIGYESEEGVRGLLAWRSYDFLGDARQLGMTARASEIRRTLAADFLQPRWPFASTRARLLAAFEDDTEDTYTLTQARFAPRLEWSPAANLLTFAAYRIERDHLASVDDAVSRRLAPEATPQNATLSGMSLGVDWNRVDDLANPTRGWIVTTSVDPMGGVFGGDASFVRLLGTLRLFYPLPLRTKLATRVRAGTIEPVAGSHEVPIWERFYAGGIDSVRGYARWRVGPLVRDQPLGGRSLGEASIELRRPITEQLGIAVFFDGGQLSLRSFDVPVQDYQLGTGFGLRVSTPIGPIGVDVGFPLDRRGSDDVWQLYLSVGQAF